MSLNFGRENPSGFRPFLERTYSAVQKGFWAVETADKGLFGKGRNTQRIRVDSAQRPASFDSGRSGGIDSAKSSRKGCTI